MAGDIVLGIRLTGDGSGLVGAVKLSNKELDKLEKQTGQNANAAKRAANDTRELERRQRTLSASAGRLRANFGLLTGAIAALGIVSLGRAIISTASEFEQLRLQLQTVSGSAELAAIQFERIKDFARRTPFEVNNLVSAFTRLQAAGINPTTELMESFGNTAAAFGRDITDFADAVVGAVTGETERLKAFGIIARIEGDKMALSFRGRTTEVRRDAAEITAALAEIGATDFAGGMARQSQSLAGAVSNAEDAVAAFFDEVGRAGVIDVATDSVNLFTRAMEKLRRVNFPTLSEELEDVEKRIEQIQQRISKTDESAFANFFAGGSVGRATQQNQLDALREQRSAILRQLEISLRKEDQVRLAAFERQQAEERRRQEERQEAERAAFAKRRSVALEHLQKIEEDRLQAEGRDAELIDLRSERELEALRELHDAKLISETEFLEAEFDIQQTARERLDELQRQAREREESEAAKHYDFLRELTGFSASEMAKQWKFGLSGQLNVTKSILGAITNIQGGESKKMFKANQALAIGEALVNTYKGAQSAYAAFAFFPPLAATMAAAATAVGLANVSAIKSQKFGGGGGAVAAGAPPSIPSTGGGANDNTIADVPAVQPAVDTPRQINVTIIGEGMFSAEQIRDSLIPLLNEAAGDGVSINASAA